MSSAPPKITEAVLHAYLDGMLEEERRTEVETYLERNPPEAERFRAYQMQNEALRKFARTGTFDPIPSRMKRLTRGPRMFTPRRVAAAAAWLLIGGIAGWGLHGWQQPAPEAAAGLWRQARMAHLVFTGEKRHAVEVKADQEKHLVAWLSKRMGAQLAAPSVPAEGFNLMGGRLLASSTGPAAQFMLENDTGARLTLYVLGGGQAEGAPGQFRYAREGTVGVITWNRGSLGFALSGTLERPRLMKAAEFINLQIPRS